MNSQDSAQRNFGSGVNFPKQHCREGLLLTFHCFLKELRKSLAGFPIRRFQRTGGECAEVLAGYCNHQQPLQLDVTAYQLQSHQKLARKFKMY